MSKCLSSGFDALFRLCHRLHQHFSLAFGLYHLFCSVNSTLLGGNGRTVLGCCRSSLYRCSVAFGNLPALCLW